MLDILEKGGWVIITIMACSLVACAVLIERWLYFRSADSKSAQIRKLLADPAKNAATAFTEEAERQSVYGKMWAAAAVIPACECDARQNAVGDVIRSEIPALERNLYLLTTAATVAPLLGLLGTVLGMIKTFQAASMTGLGNPQMLAAGISEALYNTAGGLLVAIPCIIANNHFRNRVERLLHWTEGCVGEIVRRAGV